MWLFCFVYFYVFEKSKYLGDRQIPDATDTTQSTAAEAETEGCGTYSVEYIGKDLRYIYTKFFFEIIYLQCDWTVNHDAA